MDNDVDIVLHRAGGFLAPENTIEAMEIGLTYPVDALEIDVLFTKDHIPIVYHDDTLERTTGIRKKVKRMRYEDLSDLDNGSWFDPSFSSTRIATLDAFLTAHAKRRPLYVEVKENRSHLLDIPRLIEQHGMMEETTFLSFHFQALCAIKEAYPKAKTMFLMGAKWMRRLSYGMDPRIDSYGLSLRLAKRKPDWVPRLRQMGYPVNIWSLNDPEYASTLMDQGVTSITTDRPAELLAMRTRKKAA
jgi:glycerophosphoryl diester phosphodiesterase